MVLVLFVASTLLALGVFNHGSTSYATSAVSSTDVYTPGGSDPWGTAFDSKGRVWVAMPGCDPSPQCSANSSPGKLVVFDPSSKSWVGTYSLPSGYAQPLFLAFNKQGQLWFPMPMADAIGMFDPSNQSFQEWTLASSGIGPWDVAIDSKGLVWFTEHYSNKIGYFDPSNKTFNEIATPSGASQPYGIAIDSSDNVWFTENNSSVALIGEYTTKGSLLEYKIRNGSTSGLTPHLITVDGSGNIWWSEGWVGMIGELKVSAAATGTNNGVTEYAYKPSCTTCGTHTSGISADSNGQIWFDDSLQSSFGSLSASSGFSLYNTPTQNAHPHDGLNVDAQHRIWFDEEFINKLALATQPTSSALPTATSVSSPTPTATTSLTPTPTATTSPPSTSVIAQDSFIRANQSLWGKASNGTSWGGDANTAKVFSISSSAGQVGGNGNNYSAVLGASTTNADILFTGSMSKFQSSNIGSVLRWTDGNNWYKAYIDGTNLVVQKKVKGTGTILATTPFAAKAGTAYSLRFHIVGSTLYAKVWSSSSTEPTSWMITTTDSTWQSGYCGLRMLVARGTTATFTSFVATTA
jgi:streptogramin lyase